METILQDLRFGLRALWKAPGFAVVSTITLALAIGVNTSIFSLVNVIVFADLPMQESGTVALVRGTNAELGVDQGSVSPADYLDLVERSRSFESLSALTETRMVLTGGDAPERLEGLQFTAGLTETWKLAPALGRSFAEGEDQWGADPVVMLTHGYWQSRFGGRPDVLGETLRLNGEERTIIGVASPKLEFASFDRAQVIIPLVINRSEPNRAIRYLFVAGRLAPGTTHEAATAEVAQIGRDLASEHPTENTGWGLWSAPVKESLIDAQGNTILLFLQLTVGMVILIACANVANMLLARATARAREIAVRSALGAERKRLIRQLLTESLVISLAAATLGIGVAYGLNEAMIWISAGTEDVFNMAELNGRVLGFTVFIALLAPLFFGLFPALRASATGPQAALRDGRSGDGGRSGKRARNVLVTAQISLALTLMVVATLLTRTIIAMQQRPLGFDPADLITARVSLPDSEYDEADERRVFFAEAANAVAAATGAESAVITNAIPGMQFGALRSLEIEGREVIEGRAAPSVFMVTVSDGFLDYLGIPVEAGRGLEPSDNAQSIPVVVVARATAERYWPGEDPIGQRFRVSGETEWVQVVGVSADVRNPRDDRDTGPLNVYRPHTQDARADMFLVARISADPSAMAGPIRQAITSVDPNQPVDDIRMMERIQYEASATSYALITLFGTFAFFALLMAAVGIYGVMAYSVSQRKNEIGIRMALGAEGNSVRWMILSQGTRLLVAGLGIGLVVAFGLSQLLRNVVFGVTTTDPITFIGVPLVLAAVAMLASFLPARKATRMDPAKTLRAE